MKITTTTQTCKGCGEAKPLDAFDHLPSGRPHGKCRVCINAAHSARRAEKRAENRAAAREAREECKANQRDDIRAAMETGRFLRASEVIKDHPEGQHRLPLKGGGYISIAELACRHAEREAAARAAESCETPEDVVKAVRILEEATPTLERLHTVSGLWRRYTRPRNTFGVSELLDTEDDDEVDAFDDAFGDWAPAWMQSPAFASLAA